MDADKKTIHEHYEGYVKSLDVVTTTGTGFLELAPRDPASQSKYDATKPTWLGEEATNKAVESGLFAGYTAKADRDPEGRDLPRSKATKEDWCSIQ